MDFVDIIGQKAILDSLGNTLISDRVGHAMLFSGPPGIGKKTVAEAFAGMLLCGQPFPMARCGKCTSCMLLEEGAHPDFKKLVPSGQSIGVEEIRALQSDAIMKPLYSRHKVYIICEADSMTVQAQNCLLKTLEEPPRYLVFILTAANAGALLETVRSRSVRYNFKKNTATEVAEFIKEKHPEKADEAELISALADGAIGAALELASSEEFNAMRGNVVDILQRLMERGSPEYAFEGAKVFEANKSSADAMLDMLSLLLRDLMVFKGTGNENMLINSDKKDIILKNASKCSLPQLARGVGLVGETRRNIKRNVNFQLSIEVMLMKLQEEFN